MIKKHFYASMLCLLMVQPVTAKTECDYVYESAQTIMYLRQTGVVRSEVDAVTSLDINKIVVEKAYSSKLVNPNRLKFEALKFSEEMRDLCESMVAERKKVKEKVDGIEA